jgi:hypothetical protein
MLLPAERVLRTFPGLMRMFELMEEKFFRMLNVSLLKRIFVTVLI